MYIPIDRSSSRSLPEQIADGIKNLIADDFIKKGERLPSTRDLAESIGVNRNTIVSAYELLAMMDIVESRVGVGSIVTGELPPRRVTSIGGGFPWADAFVNSYHQPAYSIPRSSDATRCISLLRAYGGNKPLVREYAKILSKLNRTSGMGSIGTVLQYGYPPLVSTIKQRVALSGVDMRQRNILITDGGTSANTLVLSLLVRPGDTVIIERPTFFQTIRWLKWNSCRIIEIPMTTEGMNLEALKTAIHGRDVKLIYTQPNAHNPTGVTTTIEHKRKLIEIAASKHIPILEDNYLSEARLGSNCNTSLSAFDTSGMVIATSTLSKLLGQGLRVGYINADDRVISHLERLQCLQRGPSAPLAQMATHELLKSPSFDKYVDRWSKDMIDLKKVFTDTLSRIVGNKATIWDSDSTTIWIETPGITGEALAMACARKDILVLPGSWFVPENHGLQAIRVAFNHLTEADAREGAQVIGRAILSKPVSSADSGF